MTIREEIESAIEANKEALKKVEANVLSTIYIYLLIDKKPKLYRYENNNHHFSLDYADGTKNYNADGSKRITIFEALGLDAQKTCQTYYKLDERYLSEPWPYSHASQIRPHIARNLWGYLFVKANQKLNTLLQDLTEDSPSSEHPIVKSRSVLPPTRTLGGTAGMCKKAIIENNTTIDILLCHTKKPEVVNVQVYCTRRKELVLMTYRHSGDGDHYSGGPYGNDGIFKALGINAHGTSSKFYEIASASSTFPSFKHTQSHLNEKIINFWIEILTLANEGLKEQLKDYYRGESDTETGTGLDLKQTLIKRVKNAKNAIAQNETELKQLETDYQRKFKIFLIRKDIDQEREIETFDFMWKKDHFSNQHSSLQNEELLIALGFDTHDSRNIYCGKFYEVERGGAWPSRSGGISITKTETINVWTDVYKLANKTIADYIRTLDDTYRGYEDESETAVEDVSIPTTPELSKTDREIKIEELNNAIKFNLKSLEVFKHKSSGVTIKAFRGGVVSYTYKISYGHYNGVDCGNSSLFNNLGFTTSMERHDYVGKFYKTNGDGVWPVRMSGAITHNEAVSLWSDLFELANKGLRHQIYKLGGAVVEHLHATAMPVVPQEHSPSAPREPERPSLSESFKIKKLMLALDRNSPVAFTDEMVQDRDHRIAIQVLGKDGTIQTLVYISSVNFFSNTPSGDNDRVFLLLGISPEGTCKKFYNTDGGNWPQKKSAITGKEATDLWNFLYKTANDAIIKKIIELGGTVDEKTATSDFQYPEIKRAKITSANPCSEVELPTDPLSWMDEIDTDLTWDAAPTPTIPTPDKITISEPETVKIDLGIKPSLNTSGIVLQEEEEITYKF